jgi:hypothetical protein
MKRDGCRQPATKGAKNDPGLDLADTERLQSSYKVIPINIGKGDQFEPEFLAITPNHRIPAIIDPEGPDGTPLKLFESAAIMIYLSEKTGGQLIPADPVGRYFCVQWMMFQMGGTGPMFGQYNHFANYAVEEIPYAIERYTNEVKRCIAFSIRGWRKLSTWPVRSTQWQTSSIFLGSATRIAATLTWRTTRTSSGGMTQ